MRVLTPYWNSRSLASNLFDEMDRLFTTSPIYDERAFSPPCEISEADEHYLMSIDLPGMKKEDIKIEVTNNVLTLSGERKRESTDDKHKVQRYERSYGFFKRSFTLPASVEGNKVEARYEDGVLELYLPKAQTAKPRTVEVQSGKGGLFSKLLNATTTE